MEVNNVDEKGKLRTDKISDSTIRRLSIYYRTLNRMEKQVG